MIEYELGGTVTFDFLPAGLTCHLRLSARALRHSRAGRDPDVDAPRRQAEAAAVVLPSGVGETV